METLKKPVATPQVRPDDSPGSQPDYHFPPYASSVLRSPSLPLVYLPHTLTERTGPVFGHGLLGPHDGDLTKQHAGEPLGRADAGAWTRDG